MKKYLKSALFGIFGFIAVYLITCFYSDTFLLNEMSLKVQSELFIIGWITAVVISIITFAEESNDA